MDCFPALPPNSMWGSVLGSVGVMLAGGAAPRGSQRGRALRRPRAGDARVRPLAGLGQPHPARLTRAAATP